MSRKTSSKLGRRAHAAQLAEWGSQCPRRWLSLTVERDGLSVDFAGWAYSLEGYFGALERACFAVQAVREPALNEAAAEEDAGERRWQRIPIFLMWRAQKM